MKRIRNWLIAQLLKKVEPGILPLEMFFQVARIVCLPVIDIVLKREGQVFLMRRTNDDPYWGGKLHIPGGVVIATDNSLENALSRLVKKEYGEIRVRKTTFFKQYVIPERRGTVLKTVYIAESGDLPTAEGSFYSLDNLPSGIVEEHLAILEDLKG